MVALFIQVTCGGLDSPLVAPEHKTKLKLWWNVVPSAVNMLAPANVWALQHCISGYLPCITPQYLSLIQSHYLMKCSKQVYLKLIAFSNQTFYSKEHK
ncbi:hypothetical protein EB796_019559 [Bugula neritina]|uniref:Uncharacterized protein n=1 Tax=Bugula neritina TaxID=10212 RepID=A0A7J7J984_BUGNE|nr:hypothetical protein EB796_019559 [Bugula neritina]